MLFFEETGISNKYGMSTRIQSILTKRNFLIYIHLKMERLHETNKHKQFTLILWKHSIKELISGITIYFYFSTVFISLLRADSINYSKKQLFFYFLQSTSVCYFSLENGSFYFFLDNDKCSLSQVWWFLICN